MSDDSTLTAEGARAVTPTTKRPSPALGARVLAIDECHALLRERGWGILSITEVISARPYAVPVAYAFDGDAIYISVGRGRKLRALENYPGVCISVCDVERGGGTERPRQRPTRTGRRFTLSVTAVLRRALRPLVGPR